MATKSLHSLHFDPKRFPSIWESIRKHFKKPKAVHIIGTNGKGSTGRFLAQIAANNGLRVGHYSSPHILSFNERIWLNGTDCDDETLQNYHEKLLCILDDETAASLSYFEYATLLAWLIFGDRCDLVIMEAGLGGEFDATAVFDYSLLIVTPIDYDHRDILGSTIKQIAHTKLNAMKSDTVMGAQKFSTVTQEARNIALMLGFEVYDYDILLNYSVLSCASDVVKKLQWAKFLGENLLLACAAALKLGLKVNDETIAQNKPDGRMQRISETVTLDVGHNAGAARAIAKHFEEQKINLIYNTLADKEWQSVLRILKPITKLVLLIKIDNPRAVRTEQLTAFLDKINIPHESFSSLVDDEQHLVTGSFSVVEAFLKTRL